MSQHLFLLGDINFKGMADTDLNFSQVKTMLAQADVVFANLECCFHTLPPQADEQRGFYVDPALAQALTDANLHLVGNGNNVNIGRAAILQTNGVLDALGIEHVGSGKDLAAASAPVVVTREGVRYGFLQRTAVYWPDNHEATDSLPGVATIKGHTAYRPAMQLQAARTRPGVPPEVVTWADSASLDRFQQDVSALRAQADIVVASLHWGYRREVLTYQREFAHAAIDAGADLVFGHGPHMILPVEAYKGRPIFYGLGNFSFHMAHTADVHHEWVGMMVEARIDEGRIAQLVLRFVERDANNQTLIVRLDRHADEYARLVRYAAEMGATLTEQDEGMGCLLSLA